MYLNCTDLEMLGAQKAKIALIGVDFLLPFNDNLQPMQQKSPVDQNQDQCSVAQAFNL